MYIDMIFVLHTLPQLVAKGLQMLIITCPKVNHLMLVSIRTFVEEFLGISF